MEKILAVYDSDLFYVTRFMEYFKQKKDIGFEISAFTKQESLEEYILNHKIEILLLGESLDKDTLPIHNIQFIYQFTEDLAKEKETQENYIYKYQAVPKVISKILGSYASQAEELGCSHSKGETLLRTIYTPWTSITGISFAWSVGLQLSMHKKVLFIALETYPLPLMNFIENDREALSEYVYYLKENPNIYLKMKTLLGNQGNLSYLTGVTHGLDLLSLRTEDIMKWIEELRSHSDFEEVVFYIGIYSEAMIELMKRSNFVVIASSDTYYERTLELEWLKQMQRIGFDTKSGQIQKVPLPKEALIMERPITISELSTTSTWEAAGKYIMKE